MKSIKVVKSGVLTSATLAIAGVMAVLACGPAAAPVQQAGGSTVEESVSVPATEAPFVVQQSGDGEKEQPTPTRDPECYEVDIPHTDRTDWSCPEPGPRNIDPNLRSRYNGHMEQKATRQARGQASENVQLRVIVGTSTEDAVDDVVEFLNANGGVFVRSSKGGVHSAGRVTATVNIELLPSIAAIEDVKFIEEVQRGQPAGFNRQGVPIPTVLEAMRVDDWHGAGVTGVGVEVAVIDFDFRDFRARVADPAVVNADPNRPDVHFFCYNAAGVPSEVDFTFCETSAVSPAQPNLSPHGTDVAETLFSVAPGATLYISNANTVEQLEQAVDWLTLGDRDNAATDTDYEKSKNDDFAVKVINHSVGYLWDGPGDGTSDLFDRRMRSPLNVLNDAVRRGAIWLNAAGNGAERTRYIRGHPSPFNVNDYWSAGSTDDPCHYVALASGTDYWFQLRSAGDTTGRSVDLELRLYGPYGVTGTQPILIKSVNHGSVWERLFVRSSEVPVAGSYCLAVKRTGSGVPLWIQLQSWNSDTTLSVRSGFGSIENPAESPEEGMLAVGAVRGPANPVLQSFSARGPVPGIPSHNKPEVTGFDTAALSGTSFASPRVAGQAALLVQVLGSSVTPRDLWHILLFSYRDSGSLGLVRLPDLSGPTNVQVSAGTCSRRGLQVGFTHPSTSARLVSFEVHAVQSGVGGGLGAVFERSGGGGGSHHIDIGTDRGTYAVTASACVPGGFCGPWSSPAVSFTTTAMVCKPEWFRAVAGDERATLWWSPDPDATGYEVELEGSTDPPVVVSGEEYEILGLVNGGRYRYRVRSLGPGGPSDWTSYRTVTPAESVGRPTEPRGLRAAENVSRRFPGQSLEWDASFRDYLYQIRIKGGGADDWKRIPFQPAGWNSPYSARMFGRLELPAGVGVPGTTVGEAIVAGLIPGTEYHFAVRAVRERDASEKIDRSPWSEVVTLETPGVRPANAPGSERCAEAEGAAGGLDGGG